MACAERSELVVLSHDVLHLLDGGGVEHVPRAVAEVARPVRKRRRGRGVTRECDTTSQALRRIQKACRSMFDLAGSGGRKSVTAARNETASPVQSAATEELRVRCH